MKINIHILLHNKITIDTFILNIKLIIVLTIIVDQTATLVGWIDKNFYYNLQFESLEK